MNSHKFPCLFYQYVYNLNPDDYKKTYSLLLWGGGFEAHLPVSSFGCLSNKPFPGCKLDVSVMGFAVCGADGLVFSYASGLPGFGLPGPWPFSVWLLGHI